MNWPFAYATKFLKELKKNNTIDGNRWVAKPRSIGAE
jgi:hypothetical protein